MAPYYEHLEDDSLRFLSFSDDSGLSCTLQAYKLLESPSYIALSYTWGQASNQTGRSDSPQAHSITLDGQRCEVQQNLHDALRYLGHRVRDAQCLLWVDAICINQEDVEERSAQVKMMKEIYERADRVFAWLGFPFDEVAVSLAVEMMREFNMYLKEGLEAYDGDIDVVLATVTTDHAWFPNDSAGRPWKAWECVAEMFELPYWQRVWIYQEATTPGDILFYYGDSKFDDVLLSATVAFGSEFSKMEGFDTRFVEAAGYSSHVFQISHARLAREEGSTHRLIDLMLELKLADCTDPKDKVYAPLGHADDITAGQIDIDYSKDLVDVYVDVARFALFHPGMRGLEVLSLVFMPADEASHESLWMTFDPRMPSWVPDWRYRVTIGKLADSTETTQGDLPLYDPSPGTKIEARICGRELELSCFVDDDLRIENLTQIWDDGEPSSPCTPRLWYDALMNATVQPKDYLDKAIRRSLVADKVRSGHPRVWRRGAMIDWALIDSPQDCLDYASSTKLNFMLGALSKACYGKRIAQLADGSIAIVPAAAKIGDRAVAFCGGHSLYVVRNLLGRSEAYSFIGECYVDGLMDGAFLNTRKRADKTVTVLRLV